MSNVSIKYKIEIEDEKKGRKIIIKKNRDSLQEYKLCFFFIHRIVSITKLPFGPLTITATLFLCFVCLCFNFSFTLLNGLFRV